MLKRIKNLFIKLKWIKDHLKEISPNKKLIFLDQETIPNIFLGPITYQTDSLMTSNNCDFISEPKFSKAYQFAAKTKPWEGFTLQWRVYICCYFAKQVSSLNGDFVECGVNTGAYSRAVIDYIEFNKLDKTFYLFDTFEGIVKDQFSQKEKEIGLDKLYQSNYKDVYSQVVDTFSDYKVKIIKGKVPDTLNQFDSNSISYLSIDMNATYPEIEAINFFWEKIEKNGIIILDDYGFPPHINQKIAFDKFAKEKMVEILCLPTGQGIIYKP